MCLELRDERSREDHGAQTGRRLRRAGDEIAVPELLALLSDRAGAVQQVDAPTGEPEQLAPTQPRERGRQDERPVPFRAPAAVQLGDPPPDLTDGNSQPRSAERELPLGPDGSAYANAVPEDNQAVVTVDAGSVPQRPPDHSARLRVVPVDAGTLGPLPPGLRAGSKRLPHQRDLRALRRRALGFYVVASGPERGSGGAVGGRAVLYALEVGLPRAALAGVALARRRRR